MAQPETLICLGSLPGVGGGRGGQVAAAGVTSPRLTTQNVFSLTGAAAELFLYSGKNLNLPFVRTAAKRDSAIA